MNRWLLTLLSAILAISIVGTASAAAAPKASKVQVTLNGQKIVFAQDPVIIQNKTYVEFRTLFSKLGYHIEYTTKTGTIKATAPGHRIQMSAGGSTALVDGKKVSSKGQMKLVNNRTMVGVRFVATLSSKDVNWDGTRRIVTMKDKGPTAAQKAAVLSVFDKILAFEAARDSKGLTTVFASDSKVDISAEMPDWDKTKTRTKYKQKIIESYSDKAAVVNVNDETVKVSGGFFPDNRSEVRYTLHKDARGQWKIYDEELLDMAVINPDKLFDQAVAMPDADKAEIQTVIDAQFKAANEENLTAYLATMAFDSDKAKKEASDAVKSMFAETDMKSTLVRWAAVEFNGTDNATILMKSTGEAKMGGDTVKAQTIVQNGAVKKDGKWLLLPEAFPLSSEEL